MCLKRLPLARHRVISQKIFDGGSRSAGAAAID
jgi:hypothetical protein